MDPNTTPALDPPSEKHSNLVNPYSQEASLIATSIVCLLLVFLAITARIFVKYHILKKIQLEDYILVFSGLIYTAFTGLQFAADGVGQGRHQWNVSLSHAKRLALLANIAQILYCPTIFCAKLAVLVQMMRIFRGNRKDSVYWSVQILIWSNFVIYTTVFFCFIFTCVPRAKIQDPSIPGRCIRNNLAIVSTSVVNIISDFTILFLPVYAVWKLKLAVKRKIAIGAVFGTGLFACISSIVRLVYSIQLTATKDETYAIHAVVLWGMAEIATVILAGAFPTIPRLLQWIRQRPNVSDIKRSSQPSTEPFYVKRHPRSDEEFGAPWDGSDSTTTSLANPYIPLKEHVMDREDNTGTQARATDRYPAPPSEVYRKHDATCKDQIQKTVHIETAFESG